MSYKVGQTVYVTCTKNGKAACVRAELLRFRYGLWSIQFEDTGNVDSCLPVWLSPIPPLEQLAEAAE